MKNLSAVLTYLMTQEGIKSAELGRKTGVGQPVVHRLMTGVTENPQILTLKPIADYFGVSIDQLLGQAPLNGQGIIDNQLLHNLTNKISTAKTITSVLADIMPVLIEGYQKAISAKLTQEEVTTDILPLLPLNINNLLKTINQIQEALVALGNNRQDHL